MFGGAGWHGQVAFGEFAGGIGVLLVRGVGSCRAGAETRGLWRFVGSGQLSQVASGCDARS